MADTTVTPPGLDPKPWDPAIDRLCATLTDRITAAEIRIGGLVMQCHADVAKLQTAVDRLSREDLRKNARIEELEDAQRESEITAVDIDAKAIAAGKTAAQARAETAVTQATVETWIKSAVAANMPVMPNQTRQWVGIASAVVLAIASAVMAATGNQAGAAVIQQATPAIQSAVSR